MNRILNAIFMLPLFGALALAGCGGGSISVAEGGIGGTGISTGTVTGIGSITVNGVKFNTDNAAIYVEGLRVDDPNLADGTGAFLLGEGFSEGQVVRVVGSFNTDGRTGTADAVYYNDSVEGPVESVTPIDAATQQAATVLRLVVIGQVVIIDSQTLLEGTTLANIGSPGHNLVEVSGLRDANGQIRAGYVRNTVSSDPDGSSLAEVKGVINSIDVSNMQFTINNLIIDYSGLPTFSPQLDIQVEVKGDYLALAGQLKAINIEIEDDIDGSENDEVEYEGIVTDTSMYAGKGTSFVLSTQLIQTSSNTIYKGGLDLDVAEGVRLEAEGYFSGGVLYAQEIKFHDSIEIEAQVDTSTVTVTSDEITFEVIGLTGISVHVNKVSEISGANDFDDLAIKLTDGAADYVEVRGRDISGGGPVTILAEEIKTDEKIDDKIKLQGPVEVIDDVNFVVRILGIDIATDTNMEFEAIDDSTLVNQIQFFSLITIGNIVEAEGTWNGVSIDWEEVGLEDEE